METDILQAISTIGFPSVVCLLALYYIVQLTKQHKDEVSTLTEVINRNTAALGDLKSMVETVLKMNGGK